MKHFMLFVTAMGLMLFVVSCASISDCPPAPCAADSSAAPLGGGMPNQAAADGLKLKAADSLLNEFVTDESAATKRYAGQEVAFIGTISEKARPKDNPPKTDVCYIVFSHFVDWNEDDGVRCYFDSLVVDTVSVGDTVRVKGKFRAYEDNGAFKTVTLGECELVKGSK